MKQNSNSSFLLPRKKHFKNKFGFTLLEIMLVVAIIALLLAAVSYSFTGIFKGAQFKVVDSELARIEGGLQNYLAYNGSYPTTAQGLQALVARPTTEPVPKRWTQALNKLPVDPWQRPYKYQNPGTHNKDKFDIYSTGEDGQDGTSDDIGNWTN